MKSLLKFIVSLFLVAFGFCFTVGLIGGLVTMFGPILAPVVGGILIFVAIGMVLGDNRKAKRKHRSQRRDDIHIRHF